MSMTFHHTQKNTLIFFLKTITYFGLFFISLDCFGSGEFKKLKQLHSELPRKIKTSHYFNITAIMMKNSGWTIQEVKAELLKASEIFHKCDISIRKINTVTLPSSNKNLDYGFSEALELVNRLPKELEQPWIIFFRYSKQENKAFSKTLNGAKEKQKYNYSFISHEVTEPEYRKIRNVKASTVAHELAHIILNSEHISDSKTPNILASSYKFIDDSFTQDQCAKALKSPLIFKY